MVEGLIRSSEEIFWTICWMTHRRSLPGPNQRHRAPKVLKSLVHTPRFRRRSSSCLHRSAQVEDPVSQTARQVPPSQRAWLRSRQRRHPKLQPFTRSSLFTDNTIKGNFEISRSRRQNSRPPMLGIERSVITRAGCQSPKRSKAASPSAATRTSNPWLDRPVRITRPICGSSSTINMRCLSVTRIQSSCVSGWQQDYDPGCRSSHLYSRSECGRHALQQCLSQSPGPCLFPVCCPADPHLASPEKTYQKPARAARRVFPVHGPRLANEPLSFRATRQQLEL